ncbi:MAG: hypothetical protein KAS32_00675 [Candidatus Peribacteraceae bacterium]|nr:hypothetical protein [Candidatus Peribacteraceae bacterium]
MNGKKAKWLRKVAKQATEMHETEYFDVKKHSKTFKQKLSKSEMAKRAANIEEDKEFDYSGFLKNGTMFGDVLITSVEVSQRVMNPKCLRSRYKALKQNFDQIFVRQSVTA